MQDKPHTPDLLESVIVLLKNTVIPKLSGRESFDTQVAVRALGIVKRELELGPQASAGEHARLRLLLQRDDSIESLNRLLCEGIKQGHFDMETPGLIDHLWAVTLDKLAIDQPNYSSYRAYLEALSGNANLESRT